MTTAAGPAPVRVVLLGAGACALLPRVTAGLPAQAASRFVWEAHGTPASFTHRHGSRPGLATLKLLLLASDPAQAGTEAVEQALRQLLLAAGWEHHIVYPLAGDHTAAVRQALGLGPVVQRPSRSRWACEDCSDPACEHRLFQDLLAQRASGVTATGPSPAAGAAG